MIRAERNDVASAPEHRNDGSGEPERRKDAPRKPEQEEADGPRILLVEDEDPVRDVITRLLRRLGYRVVSAASAEDAIEIMEDGEEVDLVLTDVVMPGLTGIEMAEVLKERHPDLRFLFTSGYTSREMGRPPETPPEPFLPKPFTMEELSERLRSALQG